MTPLKTLQTSPTRANELFAQLAESTSGAVKTRERLFSQLKEEIELLARLEHDHLLPVLKKHPGTKTIVAQTGERLRELNALLRRLDQAPKEGDEFLTQVKELKAAFQLHLRNEKNVLLPKVQKALSDEETQTVADRIEADRAQAEASAREEAEAQRADARRQRERQEAREAAAQAAEREAQRLEREERAAARAAERDAREAVEQTARAVAAPVEMAEASARASLRAAAGVAQRSLEQSAEVVRTTGETTRSFAAVAQSGAMLTQAAQGASREWMSWARTRTENRVAGFTALMQCRTPQDVIGLQGRLVREDAELLLDARARIFGIAAATAQDAARSVATEI
ncbi:MAG: phasin family protein [Proteobacteria bacterium]|nr:phasin family protein [Pseudomonadota bacterium]